MQHIWNSSFTRVTAFNMKLIIVLSVIAYGYAAKLDRTYLPPETAATAGGSPGSLTAPSGPSSPSRPSFNQGQAQVGSGPFGQNRQSGSFEPSQNVPNYPSAQYNAPGRQGAPSFGQEPFGQDGQGSRQPTFSQAQAYSGPQQPERPQAAADRNAEILRYENENDGETFSYSFETSNGISAEASGVATNGVQEQGGFAYTGDDGEVYHVTYTADENGYQPQGDHLPTPPPIPDEILRSIEENARAAAAGTQEGAYNPDEYESENTVGPYNQGPSFGQQGGSYNQGPSSQQKGPSTQYGAPSGSQGQGPTGPSAQYGAPSAGLRQGSAQYQQSPSAQYNSPQGPTGPRQGPSADYNAASSPQRQEPSTQYGAPNSGQRQRPTSQYGAPSVGPKQGPSAQYNTNGEQRQRPSAQYGAPSAAQKQGPSTQYGAPNTEFQEQSQYNAPSGAQSPTAQYRTPTGQRPGSSQYNAPNAQSGPSKQYGAPSFTGSGNQRRNQIQPSQPSRGSQIQGGDNGYEYNRPQSNARFPQSQVGQGSSGAQYNRPQSSGPQQYNRPAQGPTRPGSPGQFTGPSKIQGSFGPSASGPSGGSFPSQQGTFGPSGSVGAQSTPYQYNRPGSQTGQQKQSQGPSFNKSRPGQDFSGPRQPPSFSEQDGYKY